MFVKADCCLEDLLTQLQKFSRITAICTRDISIEDDESPADQLPLAAVVDDVSSDQAVTQPC